MARVGAINSGNGDSSSGISKEAPGGPRVLGARRLFTKKNPGAPGKLGKSSSLAESLSKLRGRGALA